MSYVRWGRSAVGSHAAERDASVNERTSEEPTMNPYHTVAVAQHNESLILVARSVNTRGAASVEYGNGLFDRLRDAASGVWSLASAAPTVLPRLRNYPTSHTA